MGAGMSRAWREVVAAALVAVVALTHLAYLLVAGVVYVDKVAER